MSLTATEKGSVSTTVLWLRGLWAYYRGYTHTAIHTASAATLTAFGLLVFLDPLFVVLAIASYICPPVILYSIDADVGKTSDSATKATDRTDPETNSDGDSDTDSDSDDGDGDSDGVDGDSDSDSDDGDSDSDSDDGDTDSDGNDADADADGADVDVAG